jgi:peptidoglycan/LPS O-acetylase OafA/YrhL
MARREPNSAPLRYRPELDGVRALAVLAVLSFQVSFLGVRARFAGHLGIDVFFVLSGYLITVLLLEEHEQKGHVDLINFYARRALRVLPPLIVMLVVAGLVVVVVGQPVPAQSFARTAVNVLFGVANWRVRTAGVLSHTWTISLIEQFYLLWPPVLLVALRVGVSRRALAVLLLVGFAALAAFQARFGPPAAGSSNLVFVAVETYAHAMGLFIGCTIALVPGWWRWTRNPAAVTIAMIGAGFLLLHRGKTAADYNFAIALFVIFTAILLANVVQSPRGGIANVLRYGPLPAIGKVSYGLYLFHLPVFWYVGQRNLVGEGIPSALVAAALLVAITVDSFLLVERRARRLQERFRVLATSVPVHSGPPRTAAPREPAPREPDPRDAAPPPGVFMRPPDAGSPS